MLKTAGHIKKHLAPCCILYEMFKNLNGAGATLEKFMQFVEGVVDKGLPPQPGLPSGFPPIIDQDEADAFRGDMFEVLAEIFFKAFENNPALGIKDYTPVSTPEDYGVDAHGINAAGVPSAVQVKYHGDPLNPVLYADIARTYTSGRTMLGLDLDKDNTIFVFTTAQDVTVACHEVLKGRVRVINRDTIAKEIDNNVNFWQKAFDEIQDTLLH